MEIKAQTPSDSGGERVDAEEVCNLKAATGNLIKSVEPQ